MMKYTVALNSEGKVVYYDGKGREKEIQITNDAARKILNYMVSAIRFLPRAPGFVKIKNRVLL